MNSNISALTTKLQRPQTLPLAFRLVKLEVHGAMRRILRSLGVHRPLEISLEEIQIPDSQIAREATTLVSDCEPAFILNHSMRSYLFGAAIASHHGMKFDPEVFYLAALMHDIGLVSPYDGSGSFELNGARAAHDFLLSHQFDQRRADMVHEAIALHAAVGKADKGSVEGALVHFGAGVDVMGFRAEDVAPVTRDAIVAAWPRCNFKVDFTRVLRDQVDAKPDCHIAGLMRLGFAHKLARAPFSE